ncbi:c-type cytochrome [Bradyrhizobium stylosanthis]|uniref:Cytochrome c2 n=1 Tax=Bradyrhizobium stylosanthis TaxID=1803665 RepID=A0A560E2H2_9BRAD|nr:cytochrome c [Bradyrhizobium stylosanthis]TWB03581.1 cytochrome c2 [Bradyrhizobium stylosanthis]
MSFTLSRWTAFAIATAGILVIAAAVAGLARSERQQKEDVARAITGGDPTRAPALIRRYGCAGCHTISGIPGGDGQVGGSLTGLRARVYIAGVTTNSPDNLVRWIVKPQVFSPRTAMPATGITEADARDVAAYLYAQ